MGESQLVPGYILILGLLQGFLGSTQLLMVFMPSRHLG